MAPTYGDPTARSSAARTKFRDVLSSLRWTRRPGPAVPAASVRPVRAGNLQAMPDAKNWVLTGSPENFAVTRERGFTLIGCKERRRRQAEAMEVGDRVIFYLTRVAAFGAAVRVTSTVFEDRTPLWPASDLYPWRLRTQPEIVLPDEAWLPAEAVKDELEHVRKWPAEHWRLAFQGQLRTVSEHDARVLLDAFAHVPA